MPGRDGLQKHSHGITGPMMSSSEQAFRKVFLGPMSLSESKVTHVSIATSEFCFVRNVFGRCLVISHQLSDNFAMGP